MCVAIGLKIKNKKNKEQWFLYKIRDRAYKPKYSIKYYSHDKTSSAFLIDEYNDWTEGINSKGIMLVSVALQNHEDKKDGQKRLSIKNRKTNRNGVILRQVLKMDKLQDVVDTLVEERFEGNTLVSDGEKLFCLEIFLHNKTKEAILKNLEIDPIEDEDDVKAILLKHITPEDYDVKVKEIKDDILVVRTNHGILLKDAGYTKEDGEGYKSSLMRRETVVKAIEDEEPNHPLEVLTLLKNLTSKNLDRDTKFCPIREDPSPYISTSIVLLTPTSSMYVVPLECSFSDSSLERVTKERDVSITILPRKLKLFEGSIEGKIEHYLLS